MCRWMWRAPGVGARRPYDRRAAPGIPSSSPARGTRRGAALLLAVLEQRARFLAAQHRAHAQDALDAGFQRAPAQLADLGHEVPDRGPVDRVGREARDELALQLLCLLLEAIRLAAGALAHRLERLLLLRVRDGPEVEARRAALGAALPARRHGALGVELPVPGQARGESAAEQPARDRLHRDSSRGSPRSSRYSGKEAKSASGAGPLDARRSRRWRSGGGAAPPLARSTRSAVPPSPTNPTSAAATRARIGTRGRGRARR